MVQEWSFWELIILFLGKAFIFLAYMGIVLLAILILSYAVYFIFIFPFRFALSKAYRERVIKWIKTEYEASNRPLGFWTTYFGGGGG